MYVGDCQSVKLGLTETNPLASGFERENWGCCCCCCVQRRECMERMRTWPAEWRVFSYGAVLPREATNMGLMGMPSVTPAWLNGDWRRLERDGGQNSLFLFFFIIIFFPFELLLFACVCVCVVSNRCLQTREGEASLHYITYFCVRQLGRI